MKRQQTSLKARVENHNGTFFARQPNGQLWILKHSTKVEVGDTILITKPDSDMLSCFFIRQAPELAD